jgi:hypothetical protein
MSAVLLAVFNRFSDAQRVRTLLVTDGFPTDRVELTSNDEPGRAALQPGPSRRQRLEQYFGTLLKAAHERAVVEALADRVEGGVIVTIAVHPRGNLETARAAQILDTAGAQEVVGHDLEHQAFEHAASSTEGSWLSHLTPDNPSGTHCIYCRLFPEHPH